jgi:hypothetical protein
VESVPEHLLFTVPENWNPPSDFGQDRRPSFAGKPAAPSATCTEAPYPTCYIVEELPPEPLREVTQDRQQGHDQDSSDNHRQEQPFSTDWGCLSFIFEMRSLLDDQIFRLARIDQRLDMLFATHSRTLPKRQCPTCAHAYAFPVGWKQTEDQHKCVG